MKNIAEFEKVQDGIPTENNNKQNNNSKLLITSSLLDAKDLEAPSSEKLEKIFVLQPKCPAGNHSINIKMLIPINLNYVPGSDKCQCKSCVKEITHQNVVLFKKYFILIIIDVDIFYVSLVIKD